MKKTRILSMFLAAVMTATSLPAIVSADNTENQTTPFMTELLTDVITDPSGNTGDLTASQVKISSVVAEDESDTTNTYLRANARLNSGGGQVYQLEIKFDNTYATEKNIKDGDVVKLSFSYRSPVENNEASTSKWRLMFDGNNAKITATSAWQNIDFGNLNTLKVSQNKVTIDFRGQNFMTAIDPLELDNVVLKNASGNVIYENNFESSSTQVSGATYAWKIGGKPVAPVTETTYLHVDAVKVAAGSTAADTNYNVSVSYDPDLYLAPGIYKFSFESRMSYFFTNSDHNAAEYEYEYAKKLALNDTEDRTAVAPDRGVRYFENKNDALQTSSFHKVKDDHPTELYHILYISNGNSYNSNYRDIRVSLNAGETELLNKDIKITDAWSTNSYTFTVPVSAGVTLDDISFGGTGLAYDNDAFDIMNVSLMLVEPFEVSEEEDEFENLVGDVSAINGTESVLDRNEGYLYVSKRSGTDTQNFLRFTPSGFKPEVGREYFVSFNIKAEDNGDDQNSMQIRAFVNVGNDYAEGSKANGGIYEIEGSDLDSEYHSGSNLNKITLNEGTEYMFLGHFKPTSSANQLDIQFTRGDNAGRDTCALVIDNFRVWYYDDNNVQQFVINNDFNNEGDLTGIYGKDTLGTGYTFEHKLTLANTTYTPADESAPMTITYTANEAVETVIKGKVRYTFNTTAKLADDAAVDSAKAVITFNFDDGTTAIRKVTVTKNWTEITTSAAPENGSADIKNVTITFDPAVAVQLGVAAINMSESGISGVNHGILMVLLKKRQLQNEQAGESTEDTTATEEKEKISGGYIYVSERPASNTQHFLRFTTEAKIEIGREYFVSYDIKAENNGDGSDYMKIRTYVNVNTEYTAGKTANTFIESVDGSDLTTTYFENVSVNAYAMEYKISEDKECTFVGHFIPTSAANKLDVIFTRGDSKDRDNCALMIDNLKVWYYDDNGNQVFVIDNDFNEEGDFTGVHGNNGLNNGYTITHVTVSDDTAE